MNDNDSPRRAADGFLAQTLPAHGTHAGPSAHSAPLDAAGPGSIVIPSRAVPSAERVSNFYEAKLADNPARHGTVQASENLAQRSGAEQAFVYGFQTDRAADSPFYQAKIAGGRSPVADGQSPQPTWATENVERSHLDFMFGTATEVRQGNIPPLSARSSVSQVGTDLSRLDLSERGRVTYGKKCGSNVKLPRYNEAEVRD